MADTEDRERVGGPALVLALGNGERGLLYKVILHGGPDRGPKTLMVTQDASREQCVH